ncbi:hypothetical protein Raf01_29720 [Rugosimonospora africana]|uniref:Uncharacterized protein n=1 Tax=Rugosimonospora africana TaxID=556532 RepID=A0A8J3VQ58_9ACTN|nr:hypothetical protein Raf01_29720 [Rugosimonospora africana]
MVEAETVRSGEAGDGEPAVGTEPRLVAEDQPAYHRVHPVGADDQVERAPGAVAEPDLHAVRGLGQRGDGVAEDVLDVAAGPVVQDPGQVAAGDLDLPAEHVGRQRHDGLAVRVDDRLGAHAGLPGPYLVQDAHPLQHRHLGAAEVDRAAAVAQRRGLLDHGHAVARAPQPVGERRTGDPRA